MYSCLIVIAFDFLARLVEGLVQVIYNKTWGWVCADLWDKKDADVACRMMDFDGALSSFTDREKSKENNFPVWLNNMQCNGNEISLFSCVHNGFRAHGCAEKKKAGTLCKPRGKRYLGLGNSTSQKLNNGLASETRRAILCKIQTK